MSARVCGSVSEAFFRSNGDFERELRHRERERRIQSGDRSSPYEDRETSPTESVSLHLFHKIATWRAEKEGSVSRKILSEMGYVGCTIEGIVELPVRLIPAWVVGNTVSQKIAKAVDFFTRHDVSRERSAQEEYEALCAYLNEQVDGTVLGIAQNASAVVTNPQSHTGAMANAHAIDQDVRGVGRKIAVFAEHIISPTSIKSIVTRDGAAISRHLNGNVRAAVDATLGDTD